MKVSGFKPKTNPPENNSPASNSPRTNPRGTNPPMDNPIGKQELISLHHVVNRANLNQSRHTYMSDVLRAEQLNNRPGPNGLPNFTFRGDTRPPHMIFQQGFQPKGNNTDLYDHVFHNPKDSNYVSTSKREEVSKGFAKPGGWIYTVAPGSGGKDVNARFGNHHKYAHEREISVPGGVPANKILMARQVDAHNRYTGEILLNPAYLHNRA